MPDLGLMEEAPIERKRISAFKVENILASEERRIVSFSVDVEGKTCTVQSVNSLEWMSGNDACTATTQNETIISEKEFDLIFVDVVQSIYDFIMKG